MILNLKLPSYLCSFTPSIGALTNGTNFHPHLVLGLPLPRSKGTQPRSWWKSLQNLFQVSKSKISLCSCFSHKIDRYKQPNLDGNSIFFLTFWLRQKTKKTSWSSYSRPLYFSTRSSTLYSRDCASAPENLILTRFFLLHSFQMTFTSRERKNILRLLIGATSSLIPV